MLALLYLFASFLLGAALILGSKPWWEIRVNALMKDTHSVKPAFLFFPACFLIGTLILSWVTYFLAVVFQSAENPLLISNLLSLLLASAVIAIIALSYRKPLRKWFYEVKRYGLSVDFSKMEWVILLGSIVFWTIFICRSLYMEGPVLRAGVSAFSDFGAHLPVVRSFSRGSNFPAQYPHFPDGTIRYHFMFYFLAGNLEYLGFNLPWALNLPSILSLVAFTMLLYGLTVSITKKPLAGFLTCTFFAFRSSFAFFTYASSFTRFGEFFRAIGRNLDANGNAREHIGNTMNESWGLWAQKVYVNQRHLAFAFGLFILALFLMLPLFMETIEKIKQHSKPLKAAESKGSFLREYLTDILFSKEAWLPRAGFPCILAGLILGLMAFWNGAVVIAGISVLFIMAALSRHKLEYLVTAVITFILSTLQSRIFVGSGTGAISIQYKAGFLAESEKLSDILSYYIELLGLLPFVLLGLFVVSIAKRKKWMGYAASILFVIPLLLFSPPIGLVWSIIIILMCLILFLTISYTGEIKVQTISPWLIPVFLAPLILATTLQLTPDITVNHKYIILSVILLNIPVADLLSGFFHSYTRRKAAGLVGLGIVLLLTSTGIVDLITLYNLDKNSISYYQEEPVQLWAQNETNPKDVFLTHYMTHYGAAMSVLLAGRSVYSGYPYFTMTAGYDVTPRSNKMMRIYSSSVPDECRLLALQEGIRYIVVEEQNRTAKEYDLNEAVLYEAFPVAFVDEVRNIVVFSVE